MAVRTEHHIYGMEGCGGFKKHVFFNFGSRKLFLACSTRLIFVVHRGKCNNKQLLDEVEHDIMNYQSRGLCYLPKHTDTRF